MSINNNNNNTSIDQFGTIHNGQYYPSPIEHVHLKKYFLAVRHNDPAVEPPKTKVIKWRIKERMKTMNAVIALCLNIGTDPPDLTNPNDYSTMEAWIDPSLVPLENAIEAIACQIQKQYELWQKKASYRFALDPPMEEIKKLCRFARRNARDERVLFHYNGHGVPKPTITGEIWVFDEIKSQYIPVSLYDLQAWVGHPSIYIFDCSEAGAVVDWFRRYEEKRNEYEPDNPMDYIILGACDIGESIPRITGYPIDLFTSCLTTPIKVALLWFYSHTILSGITVDMLEQIPGDLNTRKTPLGELNWIFTAITDTIAWSVLPRELFWKLFRQDLLVSSLFRNYLLADRIMHELGVTPVTTPQLPPTHTHTMWQAWDFAVDTLISQLPAYVNNPKSELKRCPFFEEQLTAFEVWIETATEKKAPPLQLPIVLQVILSNEYRYRALVLLARFMDKGPWAINLTLSVGIFPYALKLLERSPIELRQVLVFIWAKIIMYDKSVQLDIAKGEGYHYFIEVLSSNEPADLRAMAAYIVSMTLHNYRLAQNVCFNCNLVCICLKQIKDPAPTVRRWMLICLAKLWDNFEEAKEEAIREQAHVSLCSMLQDADPEVRAAALFGLGTLMGGAEGNEERIDIELNIGLTLQTAIRDASPLVRREIVIVLSYLVSNHMDNFKIEVRELAAREKLALQEQEKQADDKKGSPRIPNPAHMSVNSPRLNIPQSGSVYGVLWKFIIDLNADPYPDVASLAKEVARAVTSEVEKENLLQVAAMLSAESSSIIRFPVSTVSETPPNNNGLTKSEELKKSKELAKSELKKSEELQKSIEMKKLRKEAKTKEIEKSKELAKSLELEHVFDNSTPTSSYFEWSVKFYANPILPKGDFESSKSFFYYHAMQEAQDLKLHPTKLKPDTQVSYLENYETEGANVLCFHPFESIVIIAGKTNAVSVWDWHKEQKLHVFSNLNFLPSRISSLQLINAHYKGLLMVASTDGIIRIWDGYESAGSLRLVSAWKALSQPFMSPIMPVDWRQEHGRLLVSGSVGFVREWNAEREIIIQDIPTQSPSGVTTIASHPNTNLFVVGCQDGSVRIFDIRVQSKYSLVSTFSEHKNWIVGASIPKSRDNIILACSNAGQTKIWQIGSEKPILDMKNEETTAAFAVHDYAPVFATGSLTQKIRVINFEGEELKMIRFYDSTFLGQRIGPVASLAFHQYKMCLAAGTTHSVVSVYTDSSNKILQL